MIFKDFNHLAHAPIHTFRLMDNSICSFWHDTLFTYVYLFGSCFYPIIQFRRNAGVFRVKSLLLSRPRVSIWHSRDLLVFIRSVCSCFIKAHITLLLGGAISSTSEPNPSAEISLFFFNLHSVSLVYNLSSVLMCMCASCGLCVWEETKIHHLCCLCY